MGSTTTDLAIEQAIRINSPQFVLEEVQRFCISTVCFMHNEHEEKSMKRRLANYEQVCIKAELVLEMLRKYNKKLDSRERRHQKLFHTHTRKPLSTSR